MALFTVIRGFMVDRFTDADGQPGDDGADDDGRGCGPQHSIEATEQLLLADFLIGGKTGNCGDGGDRE